jgi:hypothetical protein
MRLHEEKPIMRHQLHRALVLAAGILLTAAATAQTTPDPKAGAR